MTSSHDILNLGRGIVQAVTQPVLVLDADLRVEMANTAFYSLFDLSKEGADGKAIYDVGNGQWDIPALRSLLEDVSSKGNSVADFRIGESRFLLNACRLETAGARHLIVLAISDVTERDNLLFELEGRKEFAEKLVDSVREGLLILDWDLRVHSANKSFYDMFDVTPEETAGLLIYEIGNGQWDIPALRRQLEEILPENSSFDDFEVDHEFENLGHRLMLLNGRRLDHLNLIVLAIRDITEERQAQERQKTLTGELQHRVKNILNNVYALAQQTRKRHDSLDDFFDTFLQRIDALGRSQDILVRFPTGKISLRGLILEELAAMGAEEGEDLVLGGPPIQILSRDAQTVGLMVHELATNAAKYGALSSAKGRINVTWRVKSREGANHLEFSWRESGVQIADTTPPKGFGMELIENSLPYLMGGTSEFRISRNGVACRIDFPLTET